MVDISNLELANTLSFGEAMQMREALHAALDAMTHWGSDMKQRVLIAQLELVFHDAEAQALRAMRNKE